MVVNVNRHLGEILRKVLANEGHEVLLAESHDGAYRHFRRRHVDVVLCAMDVGMVAGEEIIANLQATPRGNRAVFVLMSPTLKKTDQRVRATIRKSQAKLFLRQPFSILDFRDMLQRLERARAITLKTNESPARSSEKPSMISTWNTADKANHKERIQEPKDSQGSFDVPCRHSKKSG